MKSLLILLLLILYPLTVFAEIDERKTDIYFANGILTNEGNATANTDLLRLAIVSEIYNGNLNNFDKSIGDVTEAYNSTNGIAADLFESLLQKADESSTISAIWNGFKVIIGRYIPYSDRLVQLLEAWSNDVEKTDLTTQVDAYKKSINSGHGVVVVAHSQGNLFTNKAYSKLDPWQQKYFRMMGVASPANSVSGDGPYISYDNDPIPLISSGLDNTVKNPRRLLTGPNALDEYTDSITTGIFHSFAYYMNDTEYISGIKQTNNIQTIGSNLTFTHDSIVGFVKSSIDKHNKAPSQWIKDKTIGCGCEKRITLKHISSSATMNMLVEDDVFYGFNESTGKVYDLNGTSIKASVTGLAIVDDTLNVATNGGICYTLDGTNDDPITGTSPIGSKQGAVEVFLDWDTSSIDLDLNLVNWAGVGQYDIKDTGCPSEHFVIEEAQSVKEGHYFVEVGLKSSGSISGEISEEIVIIVSVLGEIEPFLVHILFKEKLYA